MMQSLKAEFRKLTTVRSTYVLSGIALALVLFISFYGEGFKADSYTPLFLANVAVNVAMAISFFTAIISVLLMAHEYRYNTIAYTLTLSNSRSKVLAAKIATVLGFTTMLVIVAVGLSVGMAALGASLADHHLPHQDFNILLIFGKSIFYCSGFALAALLFTALLRNITASIAVLFILPNTLEQLLQLLLKDNAIYLPFTALGEVAVVGPPHASAGGSATASPLHGAIVFIVYIVIGWAIAWYLFLRRDAN